MEWFIANSAMVFGLAGQHLVLCFSLRPVLAVQRHEHREGG